MKTKKNFRSIVMKYAHAAWNQTSNLSWRECVKLAWKMFRLASKMRHGIAKFSYIKKDGTIREALGTLVGIPAGATLGGKKVTKQSYKTLAYYDIEKESFRCFRIENFIGMAV